MKKFIIAALALGFAGAASSAELLATVEQGKGGASVMGLDLVSDGTVAGFSFAIELPGVEAKAIRSSNCVSQLPKGFSAQCAFSGGKVLVFAVADQPGTFLPAGVTPVGTIALTSGLAKSGLRVSGFETSNDNGVSTPGSAKVDGVDMGDMAAEPVAK
ncbi:MAG: hypothetical protein LW860_18420 [Xanthomonadaceae bacterium]|jgi:hypothetical protein|nr:hypothetical protein [Xanthomonadaceae bacterium]